MELPNDLRGQTPEVASFGCKFEIAALEDTDGRAGSFKGLASAFDILIDSWMPTIIHVGAFTETLKADASRIKVLWQHNTQRPIGIPGSMAETDEGLEVTGLVSKTIQGEEAMTLMRDKVVTELSIGWDPVAFRFEEKDKQLIRHIERLKLWEFSPVTFGANRFAKISEVQAAFWCDQYREHGHEPTFRDKVTIIQGATLPEGTPRQKDASPVTLEVKDGVLVVPEGYAIEASTIGDVSRLTVRATDAPDDNTAPAEASEAQKAATADRLTKLNDAELLIQ